MVDPVEFEEWVEKNLVGSAARNPSDEMKEALAEAVMRPEVTIISRAVSMTGVDEVHARMTVALLYVFKGLVRD